MTLNLCQAGHDFHESKLVQTAYGPWHIWDWEKYMDFPGYCTGQDEVSKSIEITGWWEKADTDHMLGILKEKPGLVMDYGSHIGWFSVLAADRGCMVYAVDADPENMRLAEVNAAHRSIPWGYNGYKRPCIVSAVQWATEDDGWNGSWRLVKVDIEGHEWEALASTRHLWEDRLIDYGLWELSPVFENRENIMAPSYAALVDEIASYGYRWYILKGEDRWYIEGKDLTFPQENAWAERV